MIKAFSLILGWILDLSFGDPPSLPHPIVWFGKAIAWCEHHFNKGQHRKVKGGATAIILIILTFLLTSLLLRIVEFSIVLTILVQAIIVFYCLAGTTLIHEVRNVFGALDVSLEAGRKQVARIVGRDTSQLSAQEVRMAALETLAENLSDGVVAPLFWFAILGGPGMMAYKMVNTLDSMIGYLTVRYREFGCVAAHIDDAANYFPARLTALLMYLIAKVVWHQSSISFKTICHNAHNHLSPNSGWPEAALAEILDCRFGGPHVYFGELIPKPFIGTNPRQLTYADMQKAVNLNRYTEIVSIIIIAAMSLS